MFDAAEALFFGGCHEHSIAHEAGGGITVVSIQTQKEHCTE